MSDVVQCNICHLPEGAERRTQPIVASGLGEFRTWYVLKRYITPEVKNAWSCTSILTFAFMAFCLIQYLYLLPGCSLVRR
jgi:hypothetical protein